jgi:hypothetical protein
MRQAWLYLCLFAVAGVFAASVEAQRFPQVLNMHTYEGKYSSGGFGMSLGVGGTAPSELRREGASTQEIDGSAVFRRRQAQSISRFIFGAAIDFQIGADNDVIGTDFGLRIFNMQIGSNDSSRTAFEDINESVTLLYAGFNFTINFYKSEFIESDGRRTRQDWGLAMLVGPKVSYMMGDFEDLNGLSSIGFDIGVMADFPIPIPGAEDLLTISPYMWLEANYRLNVDAGFVNDTDPSSPTFGREFINDTFDRGFYERTAQDPTPDLDGIAVRRHNFIPAYAVNIGADANLTPIFISRSGGLINNWRFHGSLILTVPLQLELFASEYVGDNMWSGDAYPMHFTISFGAAYFF